MSYQFFSSVLFALLYGEAARARDSGAAPAIALLTFVAVFLSLYLPDKFYKYSAQDHAAVVLTRLMRRGAMGSAFMLAPPIITWLLVSRFGAIPLAQTDPALIGELFIFTLLALFQIQGWGEVVTRHVMYLQQTHQYNSNQLVAILISVTLLLLILILYFLAFDLARPPELHAYLRDILAITLTLMGHSRALYLMVHH